MLKARKTKKGGLVFTTDMRIVAKSDGSGTYEVQPKVIAEPGDIILYEDSLLINLSRAALADSRVTEQEKRSWNVDDAVLLPVA